jgi:hypothetical protein
VHCQTLQLISWGISSGNAKSCNLSSPIFKGDVYIYMVMHCMLELGSSDVVGQTFLDWVYMKYDILSGVSQLMEVI